MNIIVLISGKLKYLSDENFTRITKQFKKFKVNFFLTPWSTEDLGIINKFKKKYKPLAIEKISPRKFHFKISKIKYPDLAASIDGFFFNWDGICQGIKKIEKYCNKKKFIPNYFLRYRSDIFPKKKTNFLIPSNFSKNQIIIPDRYHWHGVNDQIFLLNYKKINIFNNFFNYVDYHINDNKFFSGEYIFYKFLKHYKIKINYNNFDYNLLREKNYKKKIHSENKKTFIPFEDYFFIKFNKLKYKIRNFNEIFIQKSKRNKFQDVIKK